MIKLVSVLILIAVIATVVVVKNKEPKLISSTVEKTTEITLPITPSPATLGTSTTSSDLVSWKTYTNSKLNFKIKYPDGVQIKNTTDGAISISKGSLNIQISQHKLSSKDTVNTVAENSINSLMSKLGDKFTLVDSISPVAIGSQTGITFGTQENGKEITYYYIPQDFGYLDVQNNTEGSNADGLISLSDDIIYSLELIH